MALIVSLRASKLEFWDTAKANNNAREILCMERLILGYTPVALIVSLRASKLEFWDTAKANNNAREILSMVFNMQTLTSFSPTHNN